MDPTTPTTTASQPETPKSSRNTFLTLALLLVLAGVVGITLFLYVQNKQSAINKQKNNSQGTSELNKKAAINPIVAVIPTLTAREVAEKYPNVACRRFTDISEALQAPSIACILDLSGKNLTAFPKEILNLTNLVEINLSDNKLTIFPAELLTLKKLASINLSNNNISSIPSTVKLSPDIQTLNLTGNKLSESDIKKCQRIPGSPTPDSVKN